MRLRDVPFALAALALALPAMAQESAPQLPEISLEQRTALRCSAAFALVGTAQERGEALQFPLVGKRGREFFVRAAANIMDDSGIDRDTIAALMTREVAGFESPAEVEAAMPACLSLLEASGL